MRPANLKKAATSVAAVTPEVAEFQRPTSHHGLEHFGKNWNEHHQGQGDDHHLKHAAAHTEHAEHHEDRELFHVRKAREHKGTTYENEHLRMADHHGERADLHHAWATKHHSMVGKAEHASAEELAYRAPTAHEHLKGFGKNAAGHAKIGNAMHHYKHATAHGKLSNFHAKKAASAGRRIDRLQGMMERHGKNHKNFHKWKAAHKSLNQQMAKHHKLEAHHEQWSSMHQNLYHTQSMGLKPGAKRAMSPARKAQRRKRKLSQASLVNTETASSPQLRHFGKNPKFHAAIADSKHHLDHAHEHLAQAKHHHGKLLESEHPHEVLHHSKMRNSHAKWAETHLQHFHALEGRHPVPVHKDRGSIHAPSAMGHGSHWEPEHSSTEGAEVPFVQAAVEEAAAAKSISKAHHELVDAFRKHMADKGHALHWRDDTSSTHHSHSFTVPVAGRKHANAFFKSHGFSHEKGGSGEAAYDEHFKGSHSTFSDHTKFGVKGKPKEQEHIWYIHTKKRGKEQSSVETASDSYARKADFHSDKMQHHRSEMHKARAAGNAELEKHHAAKLAAHRLAYRKAAVRTQDHDYSDLDTASVEQASTFHEVHDKAAHHEVVEGIKKHLASKGHHAEGHHEDDEGMHQSDLYVPATHRHHVHEHLIRSGFKHKVHKEYGDHMDHYSKGQHHVYSNKDNFNHDGPEEHMWEVHTHKHGHEHAGVGPEGPFSRADQIADKADRHHEHAMRHANKIKQHLKKSGFKGKVGPGTKVTEGESSTHLSKEVTKHIKSLPADHPIHEHVKQFKHHSKEAAKYDRMGEEHSSVEQASFESGHKSLASEVGKHLGGHEGKHMYDHTSHITVFGKKPDSDAKAKLHEHLVGKGFKHRKDIAGKGSTYTKGKHTVSVHDKDAFLHPNAVVVHSRK